MPLLFDKVFETFLLAVYRRLPDTRTWNVFKVVTKKLLPVALFTLQDPYYNVEA